MTRFYFAAILMILVLALAACELIEDMDSNTNGDADLYTVTRVIDGDTIDVVQGDVGYRVRYLGVNTPERDEPCYRDATDANADMVDGQQVRLVQDESNTDRFGRLLRYVYVGDTFVNESLLRDGWAEVVLYPPDDRHYDAFRSLEIDAASANRGCHPTGIFDDGSDTR